MHSPVIEPHVFRAADLVGGHLVLDFVNTVTGRDETPRDWLASYPSFLQWALMTGLATDAEVAVLADRDPAAAAAVLTQLRALREALFGICQAVTAGDPPPPLAMREVEARCKTAIIEARLDYGAEGLRWEARGGRLDLQGPGDRLVLAAVDLLRNPPRTRLRMCAGRNCGWLFIDTSKAGRRRWCDMATCGNNAKAHRHYERTKART